MSVREIYNGLKAKQEAIEAAKSQLVQAENEAKNLRRAEAHRIWFEKQESEKPALLYNLELKASRLRKQGIFKMIEDFTDCNISMLYNQHLKFQRKFTPKQIKELSEQVTKSLRDLYTARWELRPVMPELNRETLTWENTDKVALDIRKEHRNMRNREPFRVIKTEHVDLLYDGAVLTIAGANEEFLGRIPQKRNQRVEIIESAFARAFFKPRIEVPELLQSSFREPDYNTPIGASL